MLDEHEDGTILGMLRMLGKCLLFIAVGVAIGGVTYGIGRNDNIAGFAGCLSITLLDLGVRLRHDVRDSLLSGKVGANFPVLGLGMIDDLLGTCPLWLAGAAFTTLSLVWIV